MYFTGFDTFRYDTVPSASASAATNTPSLATGPSSLSIMNVGNNSTAKDKDVKNTAVFAKLDGFQSSKKRLDEGTYLIGIYGDNAYMGKSSYNLVVLPANNNAKEV